MFMNITLLSYFFYKCVRSFVFVSILSSVIVITLYQLCFIFLIVFFHVSEDFAFFFFQVRPLLPTDRLHEVVCVDVFPYANQIVLAKQNCFTVSYALPMNCSQSQLFITTVYPLINCVLEGDVHITNIINN